MRWTTRPSHRFAGGARLPRLIAASLLPLGVAALLAWPATAAQNIRILVDGRTVTVTDDVATVKDALASARVVLGQHDEVQPGLSTLLVSEGTIRVSRVTFHEGVMDAKIPYKISIQPATRGNRPYHPTVTREGKPGIKRVTYRARLVDGREVERTTVSEVVVKQPVHAVVTARKPTQLGSRGAYAGKRTMTVVATAYDPGPGSCGKYANGITCNGKRAGYGIIAVDPKVIPLGAKLYVEGYGYGIAADVGSAIKGNHVDLGFNSRAASFKWGKKIVKLTIVD